jgi:hypothetical protein
MTFPQTVFENFLHKSGPLVNTAPPDVMNHLRAARPHQVRERAWLVMYCSIILNTVASTSLKEELQRNLWLALSDVGVLLEPSEANINAFGSSIEPGVIVYRAVAMLDARNERLQNAAGAGSESTPSRPTDS